MSVTYHVTAKQFADLMAKVGPFKIQNVPAVLELAAQEGLMRVQMEMDNPRQPPGGKVYPPDGATHEYRKRWQVRRIKNGAVLGNDAPHAIFVEFGTRPGHKMPSSVLLSWVKIKLKGETRADFKKAGGKRKTGMVFKDYQQRWAESVAFLIARAIKKRGIYPRHILTNSMPDITARTRALIEEALTNGTLA